MMKSLCGEIFKEIGVIVLLDVFLANFEVKVLKIFSSQTTEWILMKLCLTVPYGILHNVYLTSVGTTLPRFGISTLYSYK